MLSRESASSDDHYKVLAQSYRVSAAVHRKATALATRLSDYAPVEYRPTAEAGSVETRPYTYQELGGVESELATLIKSGKTAMLLCQCNYMADRVAEQLADAGIPFSNPWRRGNGRWNPYGRGTSNSLAERMHALVRPARPIHGDNRRMWTVGELWQWLSPLNATGLLTRGAKGSVEELSAIAPMIPVTSEHVKAWFERAAWEELWTWFQDTDRGRRERGLHEPIEWWAKWWPAKDRGRVMRLAAAIRRFGVHGLAADKVFVGTIHSVKGGEADNVFLFPDVSFSSYEGVLALGGPGGDSLVRTYYVGMTRARTNLYLCDASTRYSMPL
jgi:superfamily I DNA/RNA helicase